MDQGSKVLTYPHLYTADAAIEEGARQCGEHCPPYAATLPSFARRLKRQLCFTGVVVFCERVPLHLTESCIPERKILSIRRQVFASPTLRGEVL